MTREELRAYYRHLDNVVILRDNITTARGEGKLEGRAEGIAEGRAKGIAEGRAEGIAEGRAEGRTEALTETARKLKAMGLPAEQIAEGTGLSIEEIARL